MSRNFEVVGAIDVRAEPAVSGYRMSTAIPNPLLITKTYLFKYTEKLITEKLKIFRQKIQVFFIFLLKNIDCGYSLEPPRRGGSNEYPQSMFLSRNKYNNVYPCKPLFYYIKVGFKGVKFI